MTWNLSGESNSTMLFLIPSNDLATSRFVTGLPFVAWSPRTRSLTADDAGNAYVVSRLDGGGAQLDRLAAGATAFDTPRLIDLAGELPAVAPLPGGFGVAVMYTVGSSVRVSIQQY